MSGGATLALTTQHFVIPGLKSAMCLRADFRAGIIALLLDQFGRNATLFSCQRQRGRASFGQIKKDFKLATGDGACGKLQASRSFPPRLAQSFTHIGSASGERGACRRVRTLTPPI